jgi:hypothetical protein
VTRVHFPPVMPFTYTFTSTHRDLLDAYEAERTAGTQMRAWVRIGVAALGLMWLGGFIWFVMGRMERDAGLLPAIWLVLGVVLCWKFIVRPRLAVRAIRRSMPSAQELEVRFDDAGIHVVAAGLGASNRSWEELEGVLDAANGVLFAFTDGMLHWLPNRVFGGDEDRRALIEFVTGHMAPEE